MAVPPIPPRGGGGVYHRLSSITWRELSHNEWNYQLQENLSLTIRSHPLLICFALFLFLFFFLEKKLIIIITKTLYQNTRSVALQQLTARIALVIAFEETFRIPNIEASIVFFLQVITFRSYTVHPSKSVTIACKISILRPTV